MTSLINYIRICICNACQFGFIGDLECFDMTAERKHSLRVLVLTALK